MKRFFLLSLLLVFYFTKAQTKQFDVPLKSNIIWLGETHGTIKTNSLAFDFIKNLDDKSGLDYLILEGPFYTEILLNNYLADGKESSLDKLMMNYKGTIGFTAQKKEYFKKIYNFNKTSKKTIKAISIDIEHKAYNTHDYIFEKYKTILEIKQNLVLDKFNKDFNYVQRNKFYSELYDDIKSKNSQYRLIFKEEFENFYYIVRNIIYSEIAYSSRNWDKVRDSLIFENFKLRDIQYEFSKHVSFGYWGAGHTNQSMTKDGVKWVASRIKNAYPNIDQVTYSTLYSNCNFIFQEHNIPRILRWMFSKEKKGYRVSKSLLNNDTMSEKVKGTKYLVKNLILM